ncbi:Chitin synthase, class 6, partial [Coemansia spiralis]
YDPPARNYLAIAEGSRRHNMAKVYSGLYEFEGHTVPFMVVAKIGAPEEANRSGNRGKRDSQILLMSFFHKVHFNLPMTPLELEIYHQMRHIIGVPPRNYEYLLQVDADTEVMPDSLARLVSACTGDRRIAGICGETMLGNESTSWTTMIQVYEYFISHHMAKAFESLFGAVTCLPGCFSMFRLRSADGKPLLVAKPVLEAYSELHVDTLHKKNLLSLGEDRYLTTLMMKHFPQAKLKFIQDAKCRTIAPDRWAVLVSQRRRWINSTIHNLAELIFLPNMCGFCCFSMRFVVFLDLFGTLTMPCTLIYFAYLIYAAVRNIAEVGFISLILIGAIYGVQAIIFILRREWQHIGWMLIYLLAYPLWSFILPIYSFWHMDDFSWGNTRVVVGDGKRKIIVEDDKPFDPASIPQRRWMEYEKELAMAGVLNAPPPNMNPHAGSSKDDDRLSLYSSHSGAPISRAESAMALNPHHPQSMYGTPMPQMTPGYDPRLSVAMASPQVLMLQQQQHHQAAMAAALAGHDGSLARHSAASSGAMTPVDPRLSVAMGGQQFPHQQQHQSAYMGAPDVWMPPVSMYGHGTPDMRPISYMNHPQYAQPQPQSVYVPLPEMMASGSGRTTPLMYGGALSAEMPSDNLIDDAIRRILVDADLTTTTKKAIRARLAHEFGVDLSSKKDYISRAIDAMLIGTQPDPHGNL